MAETPATTTTTTPPPAKKTRWETIITSTPVIMTVIATLFAGMSASEMTWAQYHRATATQHQSKTGDQWSYFQAKKIRGTTMEMTSSLLRALSEPGQFNAAVLQQSAEQLADEVKRAEQDLQRVAEAARTLNVMVDAGEGRGNPALVNLQKTAESALNKVKEIKDKAGKLRKSTDDMVNNKSDEMNAAFHYLQTDLPKAAVAEIKDDPALGKDAKDIATDIAKLDKAVQAGKPEEDEDVIELCRRLHKASIHLGKDVLKMNYDVAVKNMKEFDSATEKLKDPFRTIRNAVENQLDLARTLHRAVGDLNRALLVSTPDETKALKDIRATASSLTQLDRGIKDSVEQLYKDHKAASIDFDARRYNEESKYTQRQAQAYELRVYKSNFQSDRHIHRKTFLFYAMLVAQAGVTVATLAMALRNKSTIWGLAALAGAAAVGFGGFVAFTM